MLRPQAVFCIHSTRRQGFALIEVLVYTGLLAMLGFFIGQWIIAVHTHELASARSLYTLSEVVGAWDLLIQDIEQAPSSVQAWHGSTTQALVWTDKGHAVEWYCRPEGLFRAQGPFVVASDWHKKEVSLIAATITNVQFVLHCDQQRVHAVTVTLGFQSMAAQQHTVYLQSGVPL